MGTTAQKLQAVANSKADIGEAILAKGGGEIVSSASYDAEIEYLESTGTQYIDTGVEPGANFGFSIAFSVAARPSSTSALFGARTSTAIGGNSYCAMMRSGGDIRLDTTSSTQYSSAFSGGDPILYEYTTAATKVNGTSYENGTRNAISRNFYLFAINNSGTAMFGSITQRYTAVKIYDGSTLVRSFVPVRKNGLGYLYDKVSGTLFGNDADNGAGFPAECCGPDKRVLPSEFSKYGDEVRKLPCSLDSLPLEDEDETWCIFVDCDGQVVAVYNKAKTQELTALPTVPDPPFDGLVNGTWNWTLEQIKASALPMCIGPMYDTNDGKSWIDIEVPSDGYEWHFYSSDNQTFARIDWGDGSSPETKTSGLHAHTYVHKGSYRVKVYKESGSGNLRSLSSGVCGGYRNSSYPNASKDIALVRRIVDTSTLRSSLNCLYGAVNLEYLVEGSGCASTNLGLGEGCSMLKQVTIPPSCLNGVAVGGSYIPTSRFWSLRCFCFPPNMTRTSSSTISGHVNYDCRAFVCRHSVALTTDATQLGDAWSDGAYNIVIVRYPGNIPLHTGTNNVTNCFRNCRSLKHIVVPTGYTATNTLIGQNTFQNCFSLEELDWLDLTNVTALGAGAFNACYKLWKGKTISFPALTSIGQNSLNGTAAKKFVIGASGTTLVTSSTGQFANNFMLEEVEFLGNVDKIQASFFNGCYMLKKVSFVNATSVPPLDNTNAFSNTPSLQKIIVPDSLYSTWIAASNWSSTTNNIVNCIVKASEA